MNIHCSHAVAGSMNKFASVIRSRSTAGDGVYGMRYLYHKYRHRARFAHHTPYRFPLPPSPFTIALQDILDPRSMGGPITARNSRSGISMISRTYYFWHNKEGNLHLTVSRSRRNASFMRGSIRRAIFYLEERLLRSRAEVKSHAELYRN